MQFSDCFELDAPNIATQYCSSLSLLRMMADISTVVKYELWQHVSHKVPHRVLAHNHQTMRGYGRDRLRLCAGNPQGIGTRVMHNHSKVLSAVNLLWLCSRSCIDVVWCVR